MHQGAEEDTAQEWEGSGGGGDGTQKLVGSSGDGGGRLFLTRKKKNDK